jgi:putative NIF3 family GTP cyclohydrolase 1 type 2
MSRRSAIAAGAAGMALGVVGKGLAQPSGPLTAGQVIDRIKAHVGVPWREKTVDRIIAGDPNTPVRGIATTMMGTLDAFKAAAAAGHNMVITHEPTFWSHQDDVSQLQQDPLYLKKLDFLHRNNMVSFHFHDHWHALKPFDGIAVGMMRQLQWTPYVDAENPRKFTLPRTTLLDLSRDMAAKLHDRTLRIVGDPRLPVSTVLASWGYVSQFPGIPQVEGPEDVFVCGETREWEVVEYAQDLIASGRKKALIMLGHVLSEQWGMKYCAEWLKGFVTEVPVEFLPIIEPFWNPAQPVFEINTRLA